MLHKQFSLVSLFNDIFVQWFFVWLLLIIFAVGFFLRANTVIDTYYGAQHIYAHNDLSSVPTSSVALVFGAGLRSDGTPSIALRDRVLSGVDLYTAGKVQKLLMTGDNGHRFYDEATAMKRLAIEAGVPEEDIVLDYAGFRTYESCYRARDIFELTQVIAVSQAYHLPRIRYICERLGIDTIGYSADRSVYPPRFVRAWNIRESLAKVKALWQVEITRPEPTFLGRTECVFDCK